jgi:hypothetical protein
VLVEYTMGRNVSEYWLFYPPKGECYTSDTVIENTFAHSHQSIWHYHTNDAKQQAWPWAGRATAHGAYGIEASGGCGAPGQCGPSVVHHGKLTKSQCYDKCTPGSCQYYMLDSRWSPNSVMCPPGYSRGNNVAYEDNGKGIVADQPIRETVPLWPLAYLHGQWKPEKALHYRSMVPIFRYYCGRSDCLNKDTWSCVSPVPLT